MSANNKNTHDDLTLEQALRGAYEQMEPTPQAQDRMRAALKAAQAKQVPTQDGDSAAGKQPRRRVAPWKVALPAAACLALAAIGVGLAASQPGYDAVSLGETGVAESRNEDAVEAVDESVVDAAPEAKLDALASSDSPASEDTMDAAPGTALNARAFNAEEYAAIEEGGFVPVATSPLSTVSADVDTASYANLRRMVNEGFSLDEVPADAVRIEEMLNYFDYAYASPAAGTPFGMQAHVGTCPWNPNTQLLVLGFSTAQEAKDAPANLVFLIDVSGSMDSPEKLGLLQDSFATLLEHLDGDDRVSIVTYSGQEEVVLEGAKGDDDKAILRAIYRLRADGSTNGEAGLKTAYEVAERNRIEEGVNRIVMASDGDLNVGMTSESALHDFVEGKRGTGIYLSVLGFGAGNYKDNKMETLADHGNGQYHYIDSIEEAEHVLSDKLMQNVAPFADDVKMQVEFNPATVKGYRLIGYENRTMSDADFQDDAKDAGDIGPNAQFTVAYEIVPAGSAMEVATPDLKYSQVEGKSGDELATCSLRYRAFADGQNHQQELAVKGDEKTDGDWTFAASVIEFGMIARDSEFAGNATLESTLELLDGMPLNDQRAAYRQLVERAAENGRGAAMDEPSV